MNLSISTNSHLGKKQKKGSARGKKKKAEFNGSEPRDSRRSSICEETHGLAHSILKDKKKGGARGRKNRISGKVRQPHLVNPNRLKRRKKEEQHPALADFHDGFTWRLSSGKEKNGGEEIAYNFQERRAGTSRP